MPHIPPTPGIDTEAIKSFLPFAGQDKPAFHGKVINVTNHIQYNCVKKVQSQTEKTALEKLKSIVPGTGTQTQSISTDDAPISRLKKRRQTQITIGESPDWKLTQRGGHSAMYSGLESLKKSWDCVYLGSPGPLETEDGDTITTEDLQDSDKEIIKKLLKDAGNIVPIFLGTKVSVGHYEGYCKKVLWPLFHYVLWSDVTNGSAENQYWKDYVKVNEAYTEAIIDVYKPGDIVWIHDYHLLLVPEMLRAKLPHAASGLFIHAPFPSSEIFRCLPRRDQILKGMLGASLIAFQTYSYSRHFISCCTRVLGYESTPSGVDAKGQLVSVGTYPIGVDVEKINRYRKNPGVAPKIAAIREMYGDKKIIVGRDKLDPVKGVVQKLNAFEKLLTDYPEWRNKVVLIQVTSPGVTESRKLETKVSELVSQINGKFGSLEFTPVHHFHQHIDRDEYYALLTVADVGLITSIRDGMNTTSMEYIICQQENHGPLILSEFTGTAGSLSAAKLVNPWDYAEVAAAVNDSLLMSEEKKKAKQIKLFNDVAGYTAVYWANTLVKELIAASDKPDQSNVTDILNIEKLKSQYKASKKRVMFFDYDGTLTPIRTQPNAARPSKEMIANLTKLCVDPNNVVWVVSGRDQTALDDWLGGIPKLGLSAEHGCFMKAPDTTKWINLTDSIDMSWKNDVIEIFTYYTERTQGSFIEHKRCALTWHYRMADPEYGEFQAKECQNHLENAVVSKLPVEILVGKKNLEVRPINVNKGEIVKRILTLHPEAEFVFCAGDDKTDEDMFRALRRSDIVKDDYIFAVTVGPSDKKTLANYHVDTSEDIVNVIGVMANISV
ncbi:glycosyltransferase family 20-domain-containing protein [Umbelopsis sp. PMI_123]|nr:glycosyltransferase family 20-domain-containing protein [Umbelopsis sp. PMI_123]